MGAWTIAVGIWGGFVLITVTCLLVHIVIDLRKSAKQPNPPK